MKKIKKLHSTSGASLLIAMVFLLFCTCVGGAVLAAATANAGRVDALKYDQQEYLNERSAALLLKEQFEDSYQIRIERNTTEEVPVIFLSGGGIKIDGETVKTVNTTIKVGTTDSGVNVTNPVERIMYECAILRYLKVNQIKTPTGGTAEQNIAIQGFFYNGEQITAVQDFWIWKQNTIDINLQKANATMDINLSGEGIDSSITATLYCTDKEDYLYDFYVDFAQRDANGIATEKAQLTLHMNASVGENSVGGSVVELDTANNKRVSSTYDNTTISWDAPVIDKGGAPWVKS